MRSAWQAFAAVCFALGLLAVLTFAAYGVYHATHGDGCPATAAEHPWASERPRAPKHPTTTPNPTPK